MDVAHQSAPLADPCAVIRDYRHRRRLKLADVATALGCSISTVSRLESHGARHAPVETLRRLAEILRIPPQRLSLAPCGTTRHARPAGIVGAVERGDEMRRRTLLTGMAGLGAAALTGPPAARNLATALLSPSGALAPAEVPAALHRARTAYAAGHYTDATRLLPPVLHAAQHSPRLTAHLVRAYALVSEIATKTNDNGFAWIAADRALTTARDADDPALIAIASARMSTAFRRDGHTDAATALLTDSADQLNRSSMLPLRGSLLLVAAYTAAVAGDERAAAALLTETEGIAARVPPTDRFSSSIVAGYAVSVHTTLGDSSRALSWAARTQPGQLPTPERRARYAVDTAHAWQLHDRPDNATKALLAAEHAAPEELRRASVRNRIRTLHNRPGPKPSGLIALARRTGALTQL